jgi:hypothetical protein
MNEANLMRSILLACSRGATRLWRNNVAQAWTGNATRIAKPTTVTLQPGDVVIRQARPLHAGLCTGSSDLIGYTVRDGVAVFTAVEVKTATGRATPEQKQFLEVVGGAGGIAGVARSVEEAERLIRDGRL